MGCDARPQTYKQEGRLMTQVLPIDAVRFVKELYPRLREDDAAVERYRAALDLLPPITVARDGVLVDGFHRWQAHRKEGAAEIAAENLGDLTDSEIIRESIRRNASHGQQLAARDKQRLAGQLWPTLDKATRVAELADLLSVSERTVQAWTKDARAAEKATQQARAWDLWLDCNSDRAIADELGITHPTVGEWLEGKRKSAEFFQAPESRQHFDVWSFQTASGESSYFGKMPPQVVENLLWLYTQPGDIVVDPFAGGGTTIDVAKAMGRRVWASDRKPATPTLPIHEHDIIMGWPDGAPSKPDFVLLDPPYWQQAVGRYSNDPTDLGNMTLENFNAAWAVVAKTVMQRTQRAAYVVSPTQLDDGSVVDHATDMLAPFRDEGWAVERRIIVTYNTQQATGQQVTWARESKRLLKLYRDLVIVAPR
jgi:DNA-binding transcriptional regulator YdaS (Cro superfamily)